VRDWTFAVCIGPWAGFHAGHHPNLGIRQLTLGWVGFRIQRGDVLEPVLIGARLALTDPRRTLDALAAAAGDQRAGECGTGHAWRILRRRPLRARCTRCRTTYRQVPP
jgi:hypothetical protein